MAVFTTIEEADGRRIADAYRLGALTELSPIQAGTVNTNYFIGTDIGRFFLRVYEQQDVEGVRYEWQLLSHLKGKGVPVAAPLSGIEPGALRVAGKPVAVFDLLEGDSLCQARVTTEFAQRVGETLARAHRGSEDFGLFHESRFGVADIRKLLRRAGQAGREELTEPLARLWALADALDALDLQCLPQGVVHGDLFRDNVLWTADGRLSGLLDWESASDGALAYDVAVTILAWCCGDTLDWDLAAALVRGYQSVRLLTEPEWASFRDLLRLGCLRFATTRITDVYLPGGAPPGHKAFGRFLERLDRVQALSPEGVRRALEQPGV